MTPSTKAAKEARAGRAELRAYLATLPPATRRFLGSLHRAIRSAAPDVVSGISYGIPVFRLGGKPLVWCAAWKSHCSLYPIGTAIARELGVTGYKTSKGTIQFPLTEPPPLLLVKRLVKARVGLARKSA